MSNVLLLALNLIYGVIARLNGNVRVYMKKHLCGDGGNA